VNERVWEIVNLLVEMMSTDSDSPDTGISLIERLVKRGYHLGEIDAALQTVFSLPVRIAVVDTGDSSRNQRKHVSRRLLSSAERLALSTEAQDKLLRLSACGLVTDSELEDALLQLVTSSLRDVGVLELLLLLMSIIRDEDRRSLIAYELVSAEFALDPN